MLAPDKGNQAETDGKTSVYSTSSPKRDLNIHTVCSAIVL